MNNSFLAKCIQTQLIQFHLFHSFLLRMFVHSPLTTRFILNHFNALKYFHSVDCQLYKHVANIRRLISPQIKDYNL